MIWLAGWRSISRSSPELLPAQSLPKSQDRHEGFVDAPLLFWGDVSDEPDEPAGVDGSDLLD